MAFFYFLQFDYWYVYAMSGFLIRVAVIVVVMTPIWVCMFEDIYLVMLAYQFLSEGLGSAIVIFGPRSCCMLALL